MKVAKEEERPKIPSKVPLHIRQLITGCWKQSPERGPTYGDVLAYLLSDDFKIPRQVDLGWLQAYEVRVIPYQFLSSAFLSSQILFSVADQLTKENQSLREQVSELEEATRKLRGQGRKLARWLEDTRHSRSSDREAPARSASDRSEPLSFDQLRKGSGVLSTLTESVDVIYSQSSCDLYNLIDPESSDLFTTMLDTTENWIGFEFPREIELIQAQMQSGGRHFLKSRELLAVDDGEMVSVSKSTSETALNDRNGGCSLISNRLERRHCGSVKPVLHGMAGVHSVLQRLSSLAHRGRPVTVFSIH
jgi:hypothetical protein